MDDRPPTREPYTAYRIENFTDVETRLARLESFARLMDSKFRIPGTSIRMGLDGVIGVVPVVGDVVTSLLASYVFAEAAALGVRKRVLARMLVNTAIDAVIGAIPVVGDLFDIAFKANARNARLVIAEVERRATAPPAPFARGR